MKTKYNTILEMNGLQPSKEPAVTMKAVLFTLGTIQVLRHHVFDYFRPTHTIL